jgi:hypothetical protein
MISFLGMQLDCHQSAFSSILAVIVLQEMLALPEYMVLPQGPSRSQHRRQQQLLFSNGVKGCSSELHPLPCTCH